MMRKRLILFYSFVMVALTSQTNGVVAQEQSQLIITPEICVVEKGKRQCKTLVNIAYSGSRTSDYCLQIKQLEVKRCYTDTKSFALSLDLVSAEAVTVQVFDSITKQQAAEKILDVVIFKPKTRHRRNFGWNFL